MNTEYDLRYCHINAEFEKDLRMWATNNGLVIVTLEQIRTAYCKAHRKELKLARLAQSYKIGVDSLPKLPKE